MCGKAPEGFPATSTVRVTELRSRLEGDSPDDRLHWPLCTTSGATPRLCTHGYITRFGKSRLAARCCDLSVVDY